MARTHSILPWQTSTQLISLVLPNSIDPRIWIECAGKASWQSTTILTENCMQPNSGDKRHCAPCAINAHGLLHVSGVHRGCGQWNGECASSCIDDDLGRVCEIQCLRRIVVLWSWQWRQNNRWMVFVRLHGFNCLHRHTTWESRVMWIVLSLIQMIHSCLMWRTIKVWEVMQTSIRPVSNITGNWVPRTTDSSWYLLRHTRWWIVMIHCFVLAHSTWPRTRLCHLLWTRWWHFVLMNSIVDLLKSVISHNPIKKQLHWF